MNFVLQNNINQRKKIYNKRSTFEEDKIAFLVYLLISLWLYETRNTI